MQPAFVYDLAFVSKAKSLSRKPEIVVVMSAVTFADVVVQMRNLSEVNISDVRKYVAPGKPDFFAEAGFLGYQYCCRIERQSDEVRLYFELRMKHLREIVVTLVFLTFALRGCFSKRSGKWKDRHQMLDIATYFNPSPHGHCLEGHSFPIFGTWLKRQRGEAGILSATQVSNSMMEVWQVIAPVASRPYADDCRCAFTPDVPFAISCFGDSCDIAIYPEGITGDVAEFPARINSHNVESPHEQITLLVGLAVMCELARDDLKS